MTVLAGHPLPSAYASVDIPGINLDAKGTAAYFGRDNRRAGGRKCVEHVNKRPSLTRPIEGINKFATPIGVGTPRRFTNPSFLRTTRQKSHGPNAAASPSTS
jgi:hypothetical protein